MTVLTIKLNLCSAQVNITAAFVHALLDIGQEIYIYQPLGFMVTLSKVVVLFCYVNDILLCAFVPADIDAVIVALQNTRIQICKEGDAIGFLTVDIKQLLMLVSLSILLRPLVFLSPLPPSALQTKQLIFQRTSSDLASGYFSYAVVVGMFLYLNGHSRPDIAFVVHQCAHFVFSLNCCDELALVHIGCYLKGTTDHVMLFTPTDLA
ncbi:hypothetical protein ACHAW6_005376 [Cyclotella cf. meneghiniana]